MKKAAIITIIILFWGIFYINACADEISLIMYVEDDCKPDKPFNLYIAMNRENELCDCRLNISYDKNALVLKNVSLKEKTNSDILYYNDNDGQTDIICMSRNPQAIVLRFQPIDLPTMEYDFQAYIYEACDSDGNYLQSDKTYQFSLRVSDDEIVQSQTTAVADTAPESKTVQKDISQETSQKSSQSETSKKNSRSSAKEESEEEISESEEFGQANIYRVIHEDDHNDQTQFFIFAGGVIIVAVCLVLVYKSGFRNGKETEKKKE